MAAGTRLAPRAQVTSSSLGRERERPSFRRVAKLNEATKELITRSLQVNLLALDAMVQSKRGGSRLRGFDEVSSQMRGWSKELHEKLEQLRELSRAIVVQVSIGTKEARLVSALQRTAVLARTAIEPTLHRHFAEQAVRERELLQRWHEVLDLLFDIDRLGMMAIVLSRSAMIEASSGDVEQRAQLGQVSREFYAHSENVVTVLKGLIKAMRQGDE
jgi:hypothetical protein